jgi:NADPH-dependent 2,4-dienoyl-CoA reductase/sulfur reductase-like enzyme
LHSASNIPHEENANVAAAIAIKNVVSIPVITSGRVELEVGNEAIARGEYDFLMMGRKLLADPDLPNKLAQGRVTDIRPCVYCYTCVSAIYKVESMLCAVNPELGVEYQRPTLITSDRKHTGIVGGGPGGMEAARRLALAGQKVTLLEKGPVLGGTLRFAGLAYEPNQRLLKWLIKEVNSLDIDIRLNTEATPSLIKSLSPSAVITAVGARRFMPELPGNDHKHVYSGEDMRRLMLGDFDSSLTAKTSILTRSLVAMGNLTGLIRNLDLVRRISHFWMPLGKRVVIVGGDLVGLELAEYLIDRGRTVTVLHEEPRMGAGLTLVRRLRLLAELREHGALLERGVSGVAIEGRSVRYSDEKKNAKSVDADSVIVARGAEANGSVAESLSGLGIPVIEIGDSTGVGYIEGCLLYTSPAHETVY